MAENFEQHFTIHRVSKNKQNHFCYNYVKLPPNVTIFGKMMAVVYVHINAILFKCL